MKLLVKIIAFLLLTIACNRIPKEIRQAETYKAVLSHYNSENDVKEKKKAALFLFRNMSSHHTRINVEAKEIFDSCALALYETVDYQPSKVDRMNKKRINHRLEAFTTPSVFLDIYHLSDHFLIQHIDSSYHAWKKTRESGNIDFDMFCHYILPYRVNNEPIDEDFNPGFRTKYCWFVDSINQTSNFSEMAQQVIQNEGINHTRDCYKYHYDFSLKQTAQLQRVNTCNDAVVYFVMLFRQLGIPASCDYTYRCFRNKGHVMLALCWQQEWYSFEVPDGTITARSPSQYMQSFPKVFRTAFSVKRNGLDVTKEYTPTVIIRSDKAEQKKGMPVLAMFNNSMEFSLADSRLTSINRKGVFSNIGVDAIYALGHTSERELSVTSIIFVDSLGLTKTLKPDYSKKQDLLLTRKYFLDKRQNFYKRIWLKEVTGICVEGSMDHSFLISDTLFVIPKFIHPYLCYFPISERKSYRYIRVSKKDYKTCVAELQIYDHNGDVFDFNDSQLLNYKDFRKICVSNSLPQEKTILINTAVRDPQKIFDNKGLTYGHLGKQGKIVYYFPKPEKIGGFAIQARNDENHILIGDTYELLLWDKGWQSLGEKIADSHELHFENVPSNALYWLRNLSRGKEEYPFIIDEQGKQYWAGQAEMP